MDSDVLPIVLLCMYMWKLSDNALLIVLFLCSSHGMSYPIAGNVKTHRAKGYNVEHPIVVNINIIQKFGVRIFFYFFYYEILLCSQD